MPADDPLRRLTRMGYYLLDHPNPNYPQTRPRTAWGWSGPTGLVTVHTAEGALDRIAPDTGAENVAGFISSRSDAGGYHVLVDTDSTIDMAPDYLMTWHTAAGNLNGPGWGISAACRSTEWDPDAEWTRTIIDRMGASIRAFWERNGHDPAAARWIPGGQVLAAGGRVVGLVHHGDVQPGDRSDAWATHPRRADLDRMLIDAIRGTADTIPPPETSEEDDMVKPTHAYKLSDGSVYTTDGLSARWLYGGTARTLLFPPNDPTIEIVSELNRVDSIEFLVTFEGSGNIPAGSADKYAKSHPA